MNEMTIQTVETPYGNFKIPCSEGTTTDQLVQHVCAIMGKNGEEERLKIKEESDKEIRKIKEENKGKMINLITVIGKPIMEISSQIIKEEYIRNLENHNPSEDYDPKDIPLDLK